MSDLFKDHLGAEQIQAYLDRELPRRAHAAAEAHLRICARCSAEVDGWRALYQDLGALRAYRPHRGFSERVISRVRPPTSTPWAARLRQRVARLLAGREHDHPTAEVLQDFVDGAVASRRAGHVARHLDGCPACAAEAKAWKHVADRLSSLDRLEPAAGFAERVLARVELPAPAPWNEKTRFGLASLFGAGSSKRRAGHVPAGALQELVDGVLPEAALARVEAHLADCARCARELESWRALDAGLGTLARLTPSEGFAARVMAGHARSKAVPSRRPAWATALDAARASLRGLVPETRQAVAALSGMAVTPTVVAGVALWTLFTHPTLTVGSLASYAWWQISDLASTSFAAFSGTTLAGASPFDLSTTVDAVASAPAVVAAAVLAYTALCAIALRVLYKNLFARRAYAHVPTPS